MNPAIEPTTTSGVPFTRLLNFCGTPGNGAAFFSADPSAVVSTSNTGSGFITITLLTIAPVGPIHSFSFVPGPSNGPPVGVDTGFGILPAANAWTLASGSVLQYGVGVVLYSGVTSTAVSNISVRMTEYAGGPEPWVSVYDLDGVSLSLHVGTITAAPGVTVSSMGVVSNGNAKCSSAFFLDGASARLNGAPYPPPPPSRRLLDAVAANTAASIHTQYPTFVVSFDAGGTPVSVADAFGAACVPAHSLPRRSGWRAAVRTRRRRR